MKYTKVSRADASRIRKLERELGSETTRRLLTGGNARTMRPERLANLEAGKGKLKPWEHERLLAVSHNTASVKALKRRDDKETRLTAKGKELSEGERQRRADRAIRAWLVRGKEKDKRYDAQTLATKRQQQKAIHALRYFGVDPTEQHYYVRKVAAK